VQKRHIFSYLIRVLRRLSQRYRSDRKQLFATFERRYLLLFLPVLFATLIPNSSTSVVMVDSGLIYYAEVQVQISARKPKKKFSCAHCFLLDEVADYQEHICKKLSLKINRSKSALKKNCRSLMLRPIVRARHKHLL